MIEVTTNALGWKYTRGNFRFRRDNRGCRQQLHLEIVGEAHLVHESLLVNRRADESRVLNGGPDLRGDCLDELLIARRERLARASVRQIHDAEWASTVRPRPHDRHGQ